MYEIAKVENNLPDKIIEKLIMNYTPTPAVQNTGEFKSAGMNSIRTIRKIDPNACVISVLPNAKFGMPLKDYWEYKKGNITWLELKRKYIEKLMKSEEALNSLREIKKSHNVYITSVERDDENSLRTVLVNYLNGKEVWK